MTKKDIVLKINEKTGIKQVVVKRVVYEAFNVIFDALQSGNRIEIRNFGVFKVKKRKRRIGRNPKTGDVVPVPERSIVVFKPGLEMRRRIK